MFQEWVQIWAIPHVPSVETVAMDWQFGRTVYRKNVIRPAWLSRLKDPMATRHLVREYA